MHSTQLRLPLGVTPEQACIMCHLSSECGGCCRECAARGKTCSNLAQLCSREDMESQGPRWDSWIALVRTTLPKLRIWVPRNYWKELGLCNTKK